MKKFAAAILTALLSLSLFSAVAYAEEEYAEYNEVGTFTVLASQCNRGMPYTDVYFGTADPPAFACGSFRIYEGECEILGDGSPEGEAALEYYKETGNIPAGTAATFYSAAPMPDGADDGTAAAAENYINLTDVKKIVFGAPVELTEEGCELMFRGLNEARYFEWDALIQFRYSLDGGKLSSEVYTLQPEEYLPGVDDLTVLSCEYRGDGSAKITLQGSNESDGSFGYIVELADAGNIATPDDGTPEGKAKGDLYRSSHSIEPGTVVKLIFFEEPSANDVYVDGDEIYGIMFCGESSGLSADEIEEGRARFNAETLPPPDTGVTVCVFPAIIALAGMLMGKRER